jgi:hypothetical protein
MGFSFKVAPGVPIRASSLAGESVQVSGRGRQMFVSALAGRAYLPVWHWFRSTSQLAEAATGGAGAYLDGSPRAAAEAGSTGPAANEFAEAFEALANVHRTASPVTAAGVGPAPSPTDQAAIRRRRKQEDLRRAGSVKRAARTGIGMT